MLAMLKKKSRKSFSEIRFTVSDNVKDHSKDPFFVKKAQMAKAFLKTHGLPKELSR